MRNSTRMRGHIARHGISTQQVVACHGISTKQAVAFHQGVAPALSSFPEHRAVPLSFHLFGFFAMAQELTYQELKDAVEGVLLKPYSQPVIVNNVLGSFTPMLLPTDPLPIHPSPVKHLVDMITGHAGDVDIQLLLLGVTEANARGDWSKLPEPFGFKRQIPNDAELQLCTWTEPEGTITIVKHLYVPGGLKPSFFKDACFGNPTKITFVHPKTGLKVWQYYIENMKGTHIFSKYLTADAGRSKSGGVVALTDEEVDKGFEFLMKSRPTSTRPIDVLMWTTKALSPKNTQSPVSGWSPALVKEAVRLLQSEGSLAKSRSRFGLVFPVHFETEFVKAVEHVWDPEKKALVFLGEPNAGKSPAGRSLLMASVRHNKSKYGLEGVPCMRIAAEVDFLRGEEGHLLMGDMLDDGDCNGQAIRKIKSMMDVAEMETLAWARWGAVKWKRGQPRIIADNKYSDQFLETAADAGETHIRFREFWSTVASAFDDKAQKTDILAIFKRAGFIVNGKRAIAYRPAGTEELNVNVKLMSKVDFLNKKGKEVYGLILKDSDYLPPDHEANLVQERIFVNRVLALRQREAGAQISRRLVGDVGDARQTAPVGEAGPVAPAPIDAGAMGSRDEFAHVKKEREAHFWHLKRTMSNVVMDLCSPPKQPKVVGDCKREEDDPSRLPQASLYGVVPVEDYDEEWATHERLQVAAGLGAVESADVGGGRPAAASSSAAPMDAGLAQEDVDVFGHGFGLDLVE